MSLLFRSVDYQDQDYPVPFSMFFSKFDNGLNPDTFLPEPYLDLNRVITWSEVVALLGAYAEQEFATKLDAPLFVPTCFTYKRSEDYATRSSLIVLDVDDDEVAVDQRLHWDDAVERLSARSAEVILCTSASNRDGYRFRVVIPISETLTPEQHKRVVIAVCETLRPGWRPDPSKMNCYSMFYVPGLYAGADNRYVHLEGEVHPPAHWCPDVYEPLPEPPPRVDVALSRDASWGFEYVAEQTDAYLATPHDRHNAIMGLMTSAAMSARNWGYDLSVGELTSWAESIQRLNHGKSPRDRRNLERSAGDAIDFAASRLHDPIVARAPVQTVIDNGRLASPRHPDTSQPWWWRDLNVEMEDEPTLEVRVEHDDVFSDQSQQPETPRAKRRLKWFSDYLNDAPIEYWDDDKLFPKIDEGVTILVLGRRGSHKTGVATQRVLDCVLGKDMRAVYVPCEDQQFYRQQRIPAYCTARGIAVSDLDFRYGVYEDGVNITRPKQVDEFIAENQEFAPNIVIVDTLRQAAPGIDMSSSAFADLLAQGGPIRKIRKAFDCIVIVLCHPPKNNANTVSGSGGIEDNSDMIVEVEYDHKGTITETITRYKNGPVGTQFFYQVDPLAVPVPTRIEMPTQVEDHKLGIQPRNFEMDETCLIRHILAPEHIDFETGLTNRKMAEELCGRGPDESGAEWEERVLQKVKHLKNIQQKVVDDPNRHSLYDELTGWEGTPKRRTWKWWDSGYLDSVSEAVSDPETVRRVETVSRVVSKLSPGESIH
jgi:hypothetical protein